MTALQNSRTHRYVSVCADGTLKLDRLWSGLCLPSDERLCTCENRKVTVKHLSVLCVCVCCVCVLCVCVCCVCVCVLCVCCVCMLCVLCVCVCVCCVCVVCVVCVCVMYVCVCVCAPHSPSRKDTFRHHNSGKKHEARPPITGCRHALANLMIVSCVLCPILVLLTFLSCHVVLHLHISIKL